MRRNSYEGRKAVDLLEGLLSVLASGPLKKRSQLAAARRTFSDVAASGPLLHIGDAAAAISGHAPDEITPWSPERLEGVRSMLFLFLEGLAKQRETGGILPQRASGDLSSPRRPEETKWFSPLMDRRLRFCGSRC